MIPGAVASRPLLRLASFPTIQVPDPAKKPPARTVDADSAQSADGDGAGESVELSFVDLMYAVPVADLAVRVSATHLHHVTPSGWTDLALALTLITFGWIGHHNNRKQLPPSIKVSREEPRRAFTTARFPQFLVEVLIVIVYFALGTRAVLPAGAGVGRAGTLWKAECLTVVFALYLVWDVLDIYSAVVPRPREWRWADRAARGGFVTLCFVGVFALFSLWASNHPHPHSVVGFDLLAIVCLYLYRVIQQYAVLRTRPRPVTWLRGVFGMKKRAGSRPSET
jgi:hypothetical protein